MAWCKYLIVESTLKQGNTVVKSIAQKTIVLPNGTHCLVWYVSNGTHVSYVLFTATGI